MFWLICGCVQQRSSVRVKPDKLRWVTSLKVWPCVHWELKPPLSVSFLLLLSSPAPEFNFQGLLTEDWAQQTQSRLGLPANSFVSLATWNVTISTISVDLLRSSRFVGLVFAYISMQQATLMCWNWSFLSGRLQMWDPKANSVHRNSEGDKCYNLVVFGCWEIINYYLRGLSDVPMCSDQSGKPGDV